MQQNQNYQISKKERQNVIFFVVFLVVLAFIPRVLLHWNSLTFSEKVIAENRRKINEFSHQSTYSKHGRFSYRKKKRYLRPSRRFNPNDYRYEDWMKLGLSEKQAKAVLKFTRFGVYTQDQLKRIVVIPDEVYELIKDSVWFPEKNWTALNKSYKNSTTTIEIKSEPVEINQAKEEELKRIKGIGPFFAKQIIRLREKLGGFNSTEQLREVWKMSDSLFQIVAPNCVVNSDLIIRISINTASAEELKQHPYIGWHIANSIVKMRKQMGIFNSLEQLKKSKLISTETFEKIKPYLTL